MSHHPLERRSGGAAPGRVPRTFDIRLTSCSTLPESLARRQRQFPLFRIDAVVTLGMADPAALKLVDQVRL
jgi:hypothetical protein